MTTSPSQLFVFDINGTLLSRVKKQKHRFLTNKAPDFILPSCSDLIYFRPYLSELVSFLHSQQIKYVLWTTAMEHNAVHLVNGLIGQGLDQAIEHLYFSTAKPIPGHPYKRYKDMQIISDKHQVPIERIFLVDDEVEKCVPKSCHLPIAEYDPLNAEDRAILDIIDQIKNIINQNSDTIESKKSCA
ncbi:hypothetical protein NEHOM01_0267 [Nematocida homosporus]|uniref:uncharacterized protein n=1 Tax=Nematocida homosporus TaxID=1912981 RepID=UPI00222099AF|nr:uncharacterized protein NEHOM01_0267 [Nematocida homosporus]KAI5184592.1 hypothetical protein NEHOM01_0267 [Nematocida homosporus]